MKNRNLHTTSIFLMVSAVLMLIAGNTLAATTEDTPINQARPAKADGTVWIHNLAGSVKVQGWDKNQVQVTGTLGAGSERLDINDEDGGISIRVVLPEHSDKNIEGSELIVKIPKASRLSINTVSADIEADKLSGTARLRSVSGEVILHSSDTDINAYSVSGKVTVAGSATNAHINAHAISSEVKVSGVNGELEAESISGSVKLTGSNRLSRAQLSSTSGNVGFAAQLTKGGSYTFNNTSGNIKLEFSATPDARFDISSFSGDIDNSFGPKPQRTSEYAPGTELHFTSGKGDAQVNVHSLSGNITLRTE